VIVGDDVAVLVNDKTAAERVGGDVAVELGPDGIVAERIHANEFFGGDIDDGGFGSRDNLNDHSFAEVDGIGWIGKRDGIQKEESQEEAKESGSHSFILERGGGNMKDGLCAFWREVVFGNSFRADESATARI
jgi:hypothetical protein